jgi:precorrin-6A/cobalt-precorrin-6A reductase
VRVLILGGSTEASELARRLAGLGSYDVIVSFAGRTRERVSVPAVVRVGGFGGVDGLVRFLGEQRIAAMVDATHPFAGQMPWHAERAAATCAIPRLRLCRAAWDATGGDCWHAVPDLDRAAARLEELGAQRVFLTTGRQQLAPFARLSTMWFLVRAIEAPDPVPLANAEILLARGPFVEADELDLLRRHRIDTVVAKNSGGDAAAPKLAAARTLGIPVVMVTRPPQPPGAVVETVGGALEWLARVARGQASSG